MIELRKIEDSNRNDVISLEVTDSQKQFIASNRDSLKTAGENEKVARPFALYAEEQLVGFTMFAFDEEYDDPEDRYWLWRFMIDRNLQGRGYGSAALETIIAYFRDQGTGYMKLSTKESNLAALSLYHRYGFRETGEMNDEEIVLRLDF